MSISIASEDVVNIRRTGGFQLGTVQKTREGQWVFICRADNTSISLSLDDLNGIAQIIESKANPQPAPY